MNEKFISLVTKYNKDLLVIQTDQDKYVAKLQNFHPFLVATYPKEVSTLFHETNLAKEISSWRVAKDMVKLIDAFTIDYQSNNITVSLGEEKLNQKLVDLRSYVINDLKVEENSWQYNLILSFFCDPMNFEMFQITKVIQA